MLLFLIWLKFRAAIKCWLWEKWHKNICNPNDIYTNHNINTIQQSSCSVKYGSGSFFHKTSHFLLFIFTSSINSLSPLLPSSCHSKVLRPLLHYWNMHVCTYDTAKWAANIFCKEVLNDLISVYVLLGWNWSCTNNVFSPHSVWHAKRKK